MDKNLDKFNWNKTGKIKTVSNPNATKKGIAYFFLYFIAKLFMWRVKKNLLEDLCISAKNFLPDEFICFLGGDKKTKTIKEIIFLPAQTTEDSATILENNIPFDETIIGTVHSHPFSTNKPSEEDKKLFSKYLINIIIGYPYAIENMAFLDQKSKKIELIIE